VRSDHIQTTSEQQKPHNRYQLPRNQPQWLPFSGTETKEKKASLNEVVKSPSKHTYEDFVSTIPIGNWHQCHAPASNNRQVLIHNRPTNTRE
jgi:hypothetical protein